MRDLIWESDNWVILVWGDASGIITISVSETEEDLGQSEVMDMADAVQYHCRTLGFSDKLLPHEVEFWAGFSKVHNPVQCEGRDCPVHNPSDHIMRNWPLHWRADRGIAERICGHGCGHPDPDQFQFWGTTNREYEAVHGCCGVCH